MFEEIQNESFDERELRILSFWKKNGIFQKSIDQHSTHPLFSFYDGPPFATGLPHYGHLLAGTIKDVIPRYMTMKGFCVPRRFGWDCHGLPVENEIEKLFELTGAHSIENFGIGKFNEECRKIVLRYTEEWKETVERMGRWVDFTDTYRTMDLSFMESVWWVFKQLFEKGLVYEGFKVMPYSAKLGTPLSNFEAGENYKDVDDPALTVAFPLEEDPNTSLLIWTTTPWTLISNLAIMVGPDIDYVRVKDVASGHIYILAKSRLGEYYKTDADYVLLDQFKGMALVGKHYTPVFSYFANERGKGAFRVIAEESISTEDGTGLVHCAPAFGEVDFYAAQKAGIGLVCPVDTNGRFTPEILEYTGQFVKDADKEIIKRLKQAGHVIRHSTIHHRYPFCWRSDTPLIYKALRTWFVAVEKIKDKLLKANDQIHWTPEHIKHGRFGKWLEGARDWAISRNRYWGTPIPIWRAEDGELLVIESIAELEEKTQTSIKDLHRHYIDELSITHNGKKFQRISEVFDCWFESGSMPYAQNHYPFEDRLKFEKTFPADFIAEGLDQTRGWFYTLTILSAALFDKPAFKNVVVNGIVLAEDGSKMSKRLKNYPDPSHVIKKYGADAIRLYMMHSPAVRAEDLCFIENGVELVLRQVLIPMWNAYSFFITYARIYDWKPTEPFKRPDAIIDQWIIACLYELIKTVQDGMEDYDLSRAVEPFIKFVDQLTNWYIRRSRRRFWNDLATDDRHQAFMTLYQVLVELTKIAAPFVPFISDAIYQNLRTEEMAESVHLTAFPTYHPEWRNDPLEAGMAALQTTVSLGHGLRKEHKLKVRQPLALAHIVCCDKTVVQFLKEQQHLIQEELNVKGLVFEENESDFVRLKPKANFRILGKKVGKLMPKVQETINQFSQSQLHQLMEENTLTIKIDEIAIVLTPEDVQVEREIKEGLIAANLGEITVGLQTALTGELLMEGLAREIINKINTMRRENDFAVTDRIILSLETTERVKECFKIHGDFICKEVLATDVRYEPNGGTEWDLNGEHAKISLSKV